MRRKLVILDRDGVINHDSPHYIKSPSEWLPIDGSLEAIARLNQAGFIVVIATNQSGIGRKLFDEATLFDIHEKMNAQLKKKKGIIQKIYYCPHAPLENCSCRKPEIGLLEKIALDFDTALTECYFIGDSERDLLAGLRAGTKTILVKTGHGEKTLLECQPLLKELVLVADNLLSAADWIITH